MSTVDDLKNGIVIDTLSGDDGSTDNSSDNDGLVIDSINGTTTNSTPTPIKLSGLSKKGNHQVILPKDKPIKASGEPTAKRVITSRPQVDISSIAKENPEEEKEFLRLAATRHIVFNYARIADYYAHSNKEVQKLMEESALVIIDINDAIANGYVKLSKNIEKIMRETGRYANE